jgi:hypothetical protein
MNDNQNHAHTNRLVDETSPYLLQHAHNPVDWYPWGPEAFERAERENKPIFLSVGYSACHWCHVMERESFEDEHVAETMNRLFVNVKVDREERPDVDDIYMTAVQLMTRQGGWPMSVWLTPDGRPFFGGTYFPPDDRMGRPGFKRICESIADAYTQKGEEVARQADEMVNLISQMSRQTTEESPASRELIDSAVNELRRGFDAQNGGFGGAPKFPPSMGLEFLLRTYARTGLKPLLEIVDTTLEKMAWGGIYDHLGGGFHRYSVDAHWLVPHFEKMLYDNALLSRVFLDGWQATHRPLYETVVRETLDYVLREMRSPEGGFYSTQDADSEGVEGKFFVWTPDQIAEAVGDHAEAKLFCSVYDVTESGNFEHGQSILHISRPLSTSAKLEGIEPDDLEARLTRMKATLFETRSQRIPPGLDDKILSGWNGLMIASMARAGAVLDEPQYVDGAAAAAKFVLAELRVDGRLMRTRRNGRTRYKGYLEDYAYMCEALLELFEADFQRQWLDEAHEMCKAMIDLFWDEEGGGFFYTGRDGERLIARTKNPYDNAVPSGNSTAAWALLRLSRWLDDTDLRQKAERTVAAFSAMARESPGGFHRLLGVADALLTDPMEIAVIGASDNRNGLLTDIRRRYLPNALIVADSSAGPLADLPLMKGKTDSDGQAAAYVCKNYACQSPVTTLDALNEAIGAAGG